MPLPDFPVFPDNGVLRLMFDFGCSAKFDVLAAGLADN